MGMSKDEKWERILKKDYAQLTESDIVEIRKRNKCRQCYYSAGNTATTNCAAACNYITIVGHRRGCDPRQCDKFEPKRGRRVAKLKIKDTEVYNNYRIMET